MNCLRMEIDKKIVIKLIEALEDLKKSVKGIDIKSKDNTPEEEIDLSDKIIIKSPIVGTAYLAPEPGGKKFIEVGKKNKKRRHCYDHRSNENNESCSFNIRWCG